MNSKTLRHRNAGNTKLETFASQQISFFTMISRKVSAFIVRSETAKSRARYKMKRQQQAQARIHQDIVNTLPVEEKLRLGMYHFIN